MSSDIPNDAEEETQPTGSLTVEAPHWTAEVNVYNNRYQPVAHGVGAIRDAQLSPGIYSVEVMLSGKSERQRIAVHSGEFERIGQNDWKINMGDVDLSSAAPLANTSTTRESHTDPAVEWSRKITWEDSPGESNRNSRLFIFVRTLKPELYKSFADGLHLLDADGKLLTDFSHSIKEDQERGWLAFNAGLPAGFYLLKRARRGVMARYQPIYLCPDWETQVFIEAENHPFLANLTINMARHGSGFDPNDETALAAQVVLNSLGRSGSGSLVAGERVSTLLTGKFENPWLGILGAYALLRSQEVVRNPNRNDDESSRQATRLLDHVRNFLTREIGDHPDVRALLLDEGKPAATPFYHPPLLRVGLNRVERNSIRFAETIPVDSLTDLVLESLVANSPWTAWRRLDRAPISDPGAPKLTTGGKGEMITRKMKPSAGAQSDDAGGVTTLDPTKSLYGASLNQVAEQAQQEVHLGGLDALQEKITLDPARSLEYLLGKVSGEDVSEICGMPLARTQNGLARLRERSQQSNITPTSKAARARMATALTATEQTILQFLQYPVEELERPGETSTGDEAVGHHHMLADVPSLAGSGQLDAAMPAEESMSADDDSFAGSEQPGGLSLSLYTPIEDTPPPQVASPSDVAEVVGKLRTEIERILVGVRVLEGDKSEANNSSRRARELVSDLRVVETDLLRHTTCTVITGSDGAILQQDNVFKLLATPIADGEGKAKDKASIRIPADERKAWEAALASASVGRSTLSVQPGMAEWELQRSTIDLAGGEQPEAYLNVFHGKDLPQLTQDTLQIVRQLVSTLTLNATLFAYGSLSERGGQLEKLDSVVTQLKETV